MPVPCPSWRQTVSILEKLPVDEQIALISRIAKDEHRMLMMPWMQFLISKHASTIAKLANEPLIEKLMETHLGAHISELELPKRVTNALMNGNVNTIADLMQRTEHELSEFCNIGRKSRYEIKAALADRGLALWTGNLR